MKSRLAHVTGPLLRGGYGFDSRLRYHNRGSYAGHISHHICTVVAGRCLCGVPGCTGNQRYNQGLQGGAMNVAYTMTVTDPTEYDQDYPIRVEVWLHRDAGVTAHIEAMVTLMRGASFAEETILRGIEDWLEGRVRDSGKENGQAVHVDDCSVGMAESVARSKMMELMTRLADVMDVDKVREIASEVLRAQR
jgi:hypothetical protein